jgi:hypothetical protein
MRRLLTIEGSTRTLMITVMDEMRGLPILFTIKGRTRHLMITGYQSQLPFLAPPLNILHPMGKKGKGNRVHWTTGTDKDDKTRTYTSTGARARVATTITALNDVVKPHVNLSGPSISTSPDDEYDDFSLMYGDSEGEVSLNAIPVKETSKSKKAGIKVEKKKRNTNSVRVHKMSSTSAS